MENFALASSRFAPWWLRTRSANLGGELGVYAKLRVRSWQTHNKKPSAWSGSWILRIFRCMPRPLQGAANLLHPPENFGGGPSTGNSPGEVGHHWWLDVLSGEDIAATTSAKLRPCARQNAYRWCVPVCVPMPDNTVSETVLRTAVALKACATRCVKQRVLLLHQLLHGPSA